MSKISGYNAIGSVQTDDLLVVVDVHDTSMAPTGTTKKMTISQLPVPSSLPPSGAAGGDLSGTYPNPGVAKVGGVAVTGTPSAGQVPTATGATAAAWQTPGVAYQPWQFTPESYGAKGDGRVVADVSTTSGSAVIGSPTIAADANAVGKTVMINGGNGTATGPLFATINAVNPGANQATLSVTAGATASSCGTFWASDDGPAFISMSQAMQAYGVVGSYKAQAFLGDKFYGLKTLYQQTSPALYNTHLPVLFPNVNGTTQQLDQEFYGTGAGGSCQFWESIIPNLRGTCLVSMVQAPGTVSATFGQQSVMGGPTGGGAFTGGFANTHVVTKGITVVSPAFPDQIGFDFAYLAGWSWEECSAQTLQSVAGNSPKLPEMTPSSIFQSTIGIGFRAPLAGNNDAVTGRRLAVEGYETHGWIADHFICDGLATIYSDLALLIDMTHGLSGSVHGIVITGWSCEVYNGALKSNGGGGSYCQVNINLDTETNGSVNPSYDVSDTGNTLHGVLRWGDPLRTTPAPVVNGAASLKVINDRLGPGPWSGAPAAPASGSPQQNTAYRDAMVWVTSTAAITAIAIDSTTVFSGSIASGSPVLVRVPSGHSYTVTGGTLTTHWVLD